MNRIAAAQELVKLAKALTAAGVTPQVVAAIAAATDRNDHTGSVMLLAKALGDKKSVKLLEAIKLLHEHIGHIPDDLMMIRSHIGENLMGKAQKALSPEEYTQLARAF